jgi:hypothetical protein
LTEMPISLLSDNDFAESMIDEEEASASLDRDTRSAGAETSNERNIRVAKERRQAIAAGDRPATTTRGTGRSKGPPQSKAEANKKKAEGRSSSVSEFRLSLGKAAEQVDEEGKRGIRRRDKWEKTRMSREKEVKVEERRREGGEKYRTTKQPRRSNNNRRRGASRKSKTTR